MERYKRITKTRKPIRVKWPNSGLVLLHNGEQLFLLSVRQDGYVILNSESFHSYHGRFYKKNDLSKYDIWPLNTKFYYETLKQVVK